MILENNFKNVKGNHSETLEVRICREREGERERERERERIQLTYDKKIGTKS